MSEFLKLGAFELAKKIRKGEASSREVVDAHIAQVEAVNPLINAMVAQRFELARQEAKAADEAQAKGGELPPLHGVPCSIKECYAVEGLPQTGGSIHRKGFLPERDAVGVRRLREAGAIVLGVTNVPELAMWMESYNKVYGRTCNPFGLGHSPGGSSGGEAAIVGAGGAPFGLGSDIGGSIRMPALFCGVYGHKPTGGAVPMTGHFPRSKGIVQRYTTSGPICRRAKDLMPLLQLLAGPDGEDDYAISFELGDPKIELKGRKVYVCDDLGARFTVGPDYDQKVALKRAALALEAKGAQVVPWSSALFEEAALIWATMVAEGSEDGAFGEMLGGGRRPDYGAEFVKLLAGTSKYTLPAVIFGAAEALLEKLPKGNTERLMDLGRRLRAEVEGILADGSLLVTPTHPRTAPKHDWALLRPIDFIYTGIFNIMEVPVTAAPMGLGSSGLPTGVQIAAARCQDHLSIGAAMILEKANGGWSLPVAALRGGPVGA
jgi:fatty acid amide hydrolase 2